MHRLVIDRIYMGRSIKRYIGKESVQYFDHCRHWEFTVEQPGGDQWDLKIIEVAFPRAVKSPAEWKYQRCTTVNAGIV